MVEVEAPAPKDFARPLARAARERPHHPALICAGRALSYRELDGLALELAGRLAGLGVGAGDSVAILLGNEPLYVVLLHAALALAAPIVPLNVRLTARELRPLLEDAEPRLLVYGAEQEAVARAAAREHGALRALSIQELLQAPALPVRAREELDPDADHAILFTSGTTGRPKGVQLSLANQWASACLSAERLGMRRDDRWLACLPLHHVAGLAIALRSALFATTVVLQERFAPHSAAHALEREGVTQVSLVSTLLARLLAAGGSAARAPALRCVLLGGGPIPPALLERARAAGYPISATYGLTESASQVATSAPGADASLGVPALPRTELRIASQSGEAEPPGSAGEILVRGPQVMRGYLGRPQDSARALRGGWLHTGDFGVLDASGRLRVLDRRSDLVVSGGENVYPSEVEAVLLEHPAVREAGVVGVADAEWGQRVEAVLVADAPHPDELRAALLAHCAEHLAGFKRPRAIHFAAELPRTASGKLRRDALRASVAAQPPGSN